MRHLYNLVDNIKLFMSLKMFTTSDIAMAICRSCDRNEQLRLQALLLVKNGLSPAKVAEDFSVHRSTVHRWMKRAEEEGLYNFKCKPGRGVKSFLTAEQVFDLRKALSEPIPTDDGFSRGWQTKDAIQFVREKFGISYSESRMRQIIKNLGFSRITCRPQSKRRNQALTNEFIAEIKKKIPES
jgi:transposase